MRHRKELALAFLAFVLGCGGKTEETSNGASGANLSSSGSSGDTSETADASTSSSGGSASSGDNASRSGSADEDADLPDGFPVTCAQFTFVLTPGAGANACAFTPADVACNSNADCTTYVDDSHCDCFEPVYGVNVKNTVKCFAPPCAAQLDADGGIYTCPTNASGLYAQNCQFVPDSQSVAVACRNHQCFTYTVATGSE